MAKARTRRVFPTRRQKRYELLHRAGFIRFECRALSFVPLTVPYMLPLLRARLKLWQELRAQGMTASQYYGHILHLYREKGWRKRLKISGKLRVDAWMMLRDFEERYKAKFPLYESPWIKRGKQRKALLAKIEGFYDEQAGMARKPKGEKPAPVGEVFFSKRLGKFVPRFY